MEAENNDFRTPPHDIEAEKSVLGAMLQRDGAEAITTVRAILKPTNFYHSDHQDLFKAILEMADSGFPVDDLTGIPYQRLYEKKPNSEILSPGYISDLIESAPSGSPSNAEHYANKIKETAILREIIQVSHNVKEKAFNAYKTGIESSELIVELQQLLNENESITSVGGKIPSIYDDWSTMFNMLCQGQKSEYLGLRTGFQGLDKATLGLRGLSVLGGIPGQGKSSLAYQIGNEITKLNNVPMIFYALEMSKWDLYVKAISRLSKLDYTTLMIGSEINGKRGQGLSKEDLTELNKATAEFMEYADKIKIIDRSVCKDISLAFVRLHIQQAKREFNTDKVFVVIDHLQIFPCDKPGLDDMKSRLDYLVAEFKAISEQLNATILLISEKNRQSYAKEDLSAFMGSAGIEYGVDLAMLLYEEGEDQRDKMLPDGDRKLHLKIAKNRFGTRADIQIKFYPANSCFEEL